MKKLCEEVVALISFLDGTKTLDEELECVWSQEPAPELELLDDLALVDRGAEHFVVCC